MSNTTKRSASDLLEVPSSAIHKTRKEGTDTPEFARSENASTTGSVQGANSQAGSTSGRSEGKPPSEFNFSDFNAANPDVTADRGEIDWSTFGNDAEGTAMTQPTDHAPSPSATGVDDAKDDLDLALFSSVFGENSGSLRPLDIDNTPPPVSTAGSSEEPNPDPYPTEHRSLAKEHDIKTKTSQIVNLLSKPGGSHIICTSHGAPSRCPTDNKFRSSQCHEVRTQLAHIDYLNTLLKDSARETGGDLSMALLARTTEIFSVVFDSVKNDKNINSQRIAEHLLGYTNHQKDKIRKYIGREVPHGLPERIWWTCQE
ncbi:hypothetical protein IAT40_004740 [Kwoniella sp. CBS 6097]